VGRVAQSAKRLATGRTVRGSKKKIPVGARIFAHLQTGPGTHPAPCTMGTGSFPGGKRPGHGPDHPPHPGELVELYIYSPSRPLVACYRVTFSLQSCATHAMRMVTTNADPYNFITVSECMPEYIPECRPNAVVKPMR
jgi:hypothetical protein